MHKVDNLDSPLIQHYSFPRPIVFHPSRFTSSDPSSTHTLAFIFFASQYSPTTYLPSINDHIFPSSRRCQNPDSNDIIQPIIVLARSLKLCPQVNCSIVLSRSVCADVDLRAIICSQVISCVGVEDSVDVGHAPICSEVENTSCMAVRSRRRIKVVNIEVCYLSSLVPQIVLQ